MSGAGKKIADVAFKASRTIDWDGMAKVLVTDEARREFSNLRRAFDEVNTQLQTKFSQEPEPIDWDFYRKGIGAGIVDMYKEAYDSIEIPKFVDTVTPEYKPKFDALLVELKEAEQKSLKESERLEKEIADVQEISFIDITYKVRTKGMASSSEKSILNGISGSAYPGELLALMGPSGSGKTTLLNVLGGRFNQQNNSGLVSYNDKPFSKHLKTRIGFVTQDDVLFPHLTVKETLTYTARLRLPKTLTKQEKEQRALLAESERLRIKKLEEINKTVGTLQ